MRQTLRELDAEALALFARKGHEGGPGIPQAGEANAVKLRRILQLTLDLTPVPAPAPHPSGDRPGRTDPGALPLAGLAILDLGCGEGLYSIEAGLHGARVLAVDARTERMSQGKDCAARHGLDQVRFLQEDVRRITRAQHGRFDVVYLLGILYHLDVSQVLPLLEAVRDLCGGLLLIDTLIAPDDPASSDLGTPATVEHAGRRYAGLRVREHADADDAATRAARLLKSIDNTHSFRFTRASLVAALGDVGFTSVLECHGPREPGKATDRVTLAARCGEPVELAAYPWINGADEADIAARLGA